MSFGSKGGSAPAGNTTSTTSQTPFAPEYYVGNRYIPWNQSLYGRATGVGNTPLSYFPGQTYASPTAQQEQAINLQGNLATHDPTMQAATGGISPYLNGSMLSAGNPYFNNMVGQIGQAIAPSIDSHFAANGRYGSGANANAFASALTNEAGQLAYQNYNDQSTNQLKAFLEAPQISQGNFADIGQLAAAGAQQQAFNQLPITEAVNRFQFNQDAPYLQAQRMASLLTGQGGTGTSTSPYFSNQIGGALGAASTLFGGSGLNGMGPSLYSQMGGPSFSGIGNGASGLWGDLFGMGGAGATADAGSLIGAAAGGLT